MGGIMDFLPQYQEFQQERDRTQEFVKNLMVYADQIEKKLQQENNQLRRQLQETKFDLEDATNSRRDLQQRLITAEAQAGGAPNGQSNFKNRDPHVVLLLDGNGLFFQEDYIRQGYDGGAKAALALQKVINSQCEGPEGSGNTHTIVKIYADSVGLDQLMKRAGIVDDCTRSFMLGFTQADTYFDYIDVGDQAAQTRSKLQDAAKWHLQDPSCKQVLLGISHDASHATFIKDLVENEEINRRVTILEGQPTVNELRSTEVNVIAFDGIFRADKPVEIRSYTQSVTSASSIAPSTPSSTVVTPAMAPARIATPSLPARTATPSAAPGTMTWASITRKATPPPVITLPIPLKTNTSNRSVSASKPPPQPDWNPGPRGLDVPIPINQTVLDTVKKRKDSAKLCNNHYLRGPCTKGEDCCFEHNYKPNKEELNAIAFLARLNPCTSGQDCEVDNCIYGHHCPSVVNNTCVHPFCKFRTEEHPPGTKYKFPRTGSE